MGFTVSDFAIGYVQPPQAYVCLGSQTTNIMRNAAGVKYRLTVSFDVYYSLAEKESEARPIDTLIVIENEAAIPQDLMAWAYDKVKQRFVGKILQDNI
jgi:hypothetical protein